jgi:hypothetical protein
MAKIEINGTEFILNESISIISIVKSLNGDDVKLEDCIWSGKKKFKKIIEIKSGG